MGLVSFLADVLNPPPAPQARVVTLVIVPREDGGLRVSSPDMRGLLLSGAVPSAVLRDVGPALDALLYGNRKARGRRP
jgi:hypothetical protein